MAHTLGTRLRPFMRRRTKGQVATNLPDKTVHTISVLLGTKQAEMYESVTVTMDKRLIASLTEEDFRYLLGD